MIDETKEIHVFAKFIKIKVDQNNSSIQKISPKWKALTNLDENLCSSRNRAKYSLNVL